MYEGHTKGQRDKAARMIDMALKLGYRVSVQDDEGGWFIKRSADRAEILANLGEMDMDWMKFHDGSGACVGAMMLVWGNAADGSELAADYTANVHMEMIANA